MYYDFLAKIPEGTGKISLNTRNGTTYVEYTYARKYIPEKKYNVPKRTTIGKVCEEDTTMMYPNPNYLKFFPETEVPDEMDRSRRSCCLKIKHLFRKLIEKHWKMLKRRRLRQKNRERT